MKVQFLKLYEEEFHDLIGEDIIDRRGVDASVVVNQAAGLFCICSSSLYGSKLHP